MKFGAGADGDPFVKVKVQDNVSAVQKQASCLYLTMRLNRIGAAVFEQLTDGSKMFYHDAANSVWQHKWRSVWTRTRFRLSCSEEYAQVINICSPVQEEMKEREDPSRASQQCAVISPSTIRRRIAVWVKLDSSKSDGQSRVYEISGDTRESVNKANRLDQKFVDTCNDEYAEWLRTNRFSFQFRSKQGS